MASAAPKVHLHIGGEQRTSGSGGTHPHLHPVTQVVQAEIPLAGPKEVEEAVNKAEIVREEWRRTTPETNGDILYRLADLLEANESDVAEMAAFDGGTTLMVGERGVETAIGWTLYYAGWCYKLT